MPSRFPNPDASAERRARRQASVLTLIWIELGDCSVRHSNSAVRKSDVFPSSTEAVARQICAAFREIQERLLLDYWQTVSPAAVSGKKAKWSLKRSNSHHGFSADTVPFEPRINRCCAPRAGMRDRATKPSYCPAVKLMTGRAIAD